MFYHSLASQLSGVLLQDGWTPLHFAAYGGAEQVSRELLGLGARPRTADKVRL